MPALEALLAPENLLVNVVCGLSVQFVYLGLLTWVLPPRSARTFWTVEILYQGVAMFLKALSTLRRFALLLASSAPSLFRCFCCGGVCCVGWWCARCVSPSEKAEDKKAHFPDF